MTGRKPSHVLNHLSRIPSMTKPRSDSPAAEALRIIRGEDAMDRPTLIRGFVVIAAVTIIGLAFVWSYVGALHQPAFHGVELAVVGPTGVVKQLNASGEFAATSVPSRQAAIQRIDDRKDYGAIIVGRRGINVLVAQAAGRSVAVALQATLPSALRAAAGTRTRVAVTDVKPLPQTDFNGLTPFYLALGIVVASFMGAMFFGVVFGLKPLGRRVWWRILGFSILALALGLGEVGIVNAVGPLRGHYVVLVLVGLLLGTTVATVTVALQSLIGVLGSFVAILLFVVLGNPASGGPYATELLPGIWRTIGPYLPTGAGTDLFRNIVYFDGNTTTRPLLVLFVWLAGGLVLAAVGTRIRPLGLHMQPDREQLQPAEAALGAV